MAVEGLDAGAPEEATAPAPAKRVRKAPAKKAAPARKRTARGADAAIDEETAAAVLAAGPPVVEAVEDDPVVAENAADDVPSTVFAAPAETAPAPAETAPAPAETAPAPADAVEEPPARPRRRRAPAIVTFQAPEPDPVVADAPEDLDEEAPQAPAPRRRRRAGTSGAAAPADLMPTMLAAEQAADALAPDAAAPDAAPGSGPGEDDEDDDRPRRRRRGRRGRGSRSAEDEAADGEGVEGNGVEGNGVEADGGPAEAGPAQEQLGGAEDEEGATGTRRRRRRRRTGAGSGDEGEGDEAAGDEVATVVHVREPRASRVRGEKAADEDGVRGITGSTRMAAKRARRQEGRDSGRRRPPILSESEFLARREAVDRVMVVRQRGELTQMAVLEDGVLVEHYVTKATAEAYAGNVYLGRVQNILPSMEAAFVDIGKGRNAVLYAGEVNYDAGIPGGSGPRKIERALKSGQEVLVQVSKDPIGHKGARLTSQISLPGRYLVYVPEGSMTGISRKLPENERTRLKAILKKVVPENAGVIIRTAAEGASEEEISADVRRLQAQWEAIRTTASKGGAPVLLHAEPDLVIRVVRDVFNEDFSRLVVSGEREWETIREYVEFVAPDLAPRLSRHTSERDVFAEHRVDEQLAKALDRKVYLPSGGSLVIDRTEAMVVIDVNTGKFVGKGGNLEETVTRNNLEAAEEVARQLRLRDLGGIIVVDFIDMVLESNRDLVVRRLVECLGRDRTKHQVAEVTSLGLVQMTRKRVGQGLLESFSETCDHCNGRGVIVRTDPVEAPRGDRVERMERVASASRRQAAALPVVAEPAADGEPAGAGERAGDGEPAATAPKRRRRGGRGTGAATATPHDELAEILAEPAGSEILDPATDPEAGAERAEAGGDLAELAQPGESGESGEPGGQPADAADLEPLDLDAGPVEAGLEGAPPVELPDAAADLLPELADQPTAAEEDMPVFPEPEPEPEPAPEPAVDAAPAPRRRRRATSRPAGPAGTAGPAGPA